MRAEEVGEGVGVGSPPAEEGNDAEGKDGEKAREAQAVESEAVEKEAEVGDGIDEGYDLAQSAAGCRFGLCSWAYHVPHEGSMVDHGRVQGELNGRRGPDAW